MPRRVGAYAKLLSNYASDDAIIAAGEEAELLFVRGLAFCSTSDSDGYITEAQVYRFVAAGMKRVPQRISALVREGVWVAADGGYVVRNWTKVHDTAEEKGRKRKTDRERKRRANPNGIHAESDRNPDGATPDSLLCSYVSSSSTTEQNTTEQSSGANGSAEPTPRKRGTRIPEDWHPDDDTRAWTLQRIDQGTAAIELEKFRNYWLAKTGRDATKLDWALTWRNWVLNATPGRTSPRTPQQQTDDLFDRAARRMGVQ